MRSKSENFFSLVSKVMDLEVKYEEKLDKYNHLYFLFNSFGKKNDHKRVVAQFECKLLKTNIDELIEQISKTAQDDDMKAYYELYKEKTELLKKAWNCETEIGYIDSRLIFDPICDDEIENGLSLKRDEFSKQKEFLEEQMKEITEKMLKICA